MTRPYDDELGPRHMTHVYEDADGRTVQEEWRLLSQHTEHEEGREGGIYTAPFGEHVVYVRQAWTLKKTLVEEEVLA